MLYTGPGGLVAHECILDLRPLTRTSGVTVDDVAKRLIEYGFHSPTPVLPGGGHPDGEPTESENKAELDRFIDDMVAIRAEADAIEGGQVELAVPHCVTPRTARCLTEDWTAPYTRAARTCRPNIGRPRGGSTAPTVTATLGAPARPWSTSPSEVKSQPA